MNDDIIMTLTREEMIGEDLDYVPHRNFLGMVLCYYTLESRETTQNHWAFRLLSYDEADERGLGDENKLLSTASENTMKIFPYKIRKLGDGMYVLTNKQNIFGATTLLYPDAVLKVSKKAGGDMYIVPSSVNEVICVSTWRADPRSLRFKLINDNRGETPEDSVLSDDIFFYDSESNSVDTLVGGAVLVR